MADLAAPLVQQVFDVASRQRVTEREHHRQADDLGAGLDGPKRERREISRSSAKASSVSRGFVLTVLHFGHGPKSFTLFGDEPRPLPSGLSDEKRLFSGSASTTGVPEATSRTRLGQGWKTTEPAIDHDLQGMKASLGLCNDFPIIDGAKASLQARPRLSGEHSFADI
jgi:hypothetical protein